MNKKNIIILLAVLVLALGISFSYYTFNKPLKTTEIKDSPFSILLQNATDTYTESSEWYEAKITYPKNNQKVRDMLIKKWQEFAEENQLKKYNNLGEAKEGLQINVDDLKYTFVADYKLATSTNTITYVYEIYNFTGGAHGGTAVFPITMDTSLNIIPVTTILPDDKLSKVAALAKTDILKQKRERLQSYGGMSPNDIDESIKSDMSMFVDEGTKPIRENYSDVWPDGDNLVISFGQYQVGPYVEGLYEVKIPNSSI